MRTMNDTVKTVTYFKINEIKNQYQPISPNILKFLRHFCDIIKTLERDKGQAFLSWPCLNPHVISLQKEG